MYWIAHIFGLDSGSGPAYLFWSGIGSDIGEVTIIGGLIAVYRKNNCEVHGCWRLGKHMTAAGHHVCRKHHPDGHLTPAMVAERHDALKPF